MLDFRARGGMLDFRANGGGANGTRIAIYSSFVS